MKADSFTIIAVGDIDLPPDWEEDEDEEDVFLPYEEDMDAWLPVVAQVADQYFAWANVGMLANYIALGIPEVECAVFTLDNPGLPENLRTELKGLIH